MKSKFVRPIIVFREAVANAQRTVETANFDAPYTAEFEHDRMTEANTALLDQAFFSEPLTTYAVGFQDDKVVDAALEFYAPIVPVSRKFTYSTFDNAEAFTSDTNDVRSIRSDFKEIEYTSGKINAATINRGLQISIDLDEVDGMTNWEESYTQKLIRRLKRNSLRRAVALLQATAVANSASTAKTWDTTALKDPDQDVILELIASADTVGMRPNRIGYGDTSWAKRLLSHRAQTNAGGFGSSALTPEQLAGFLQVDAVNVCPSRYTSGSSARAQIVANAVLMFMAEAGVDTSDASNIKRFVTMGSSAQGGGIYQVYVQRVSAKRYVIAVGTYELTKITSAIGVRQFIIA